MKNTGEQMRNMFDLTIATFWPRYCCQAFLTVSYSLTCLASANACATASHIEWCLHVASFRVARKFGKIRSDVGIRHDRRNAYDLWQRLLCQFYQVIL